MINSLGSLHKRKTTSRSQSLFVTNYGANHNRNLLANWLQLQEGIGCHTLTIYETAIRCAELQGYESLSAFVRDAVLYKVNATKILRENVLEAEQRRQLHEIRKTLQSLEDSKTVTDKGLGCGFASRISRQSVMLVAFGILMHRYSN